MARDDDGTFVRWLVQLINSRPRKRWPARLRSEALWFCVGAGPRPKGASPAVPLARPIRAGEGLTDAQMTEVAALARALRGGGEATPMFSERPRVWFFAAGGRLRALPEYRDMPRRDAFLWRVYEALMATDARVKFCARPRCGRAFIARKRQAYCRPAHAVPVAARGKKYREAHKQQLAFARAERRGTRPRG
jgi:hypothetical protein